MLFRDLYAWFYMPVSVHKLLIHGADVIRSHLLPIGIYSEEAQGDRTKHVRQYSYSIHAKKSSRQNTLTDQFSYLLTTSDPFISNLIQTNIDARERKVRSRDVALSGIAQENPLFEEDDRQEMEEEEEGEGDPDETCSSSADTSSVSAHSDSSSSLPGTDESFVNRLSIAAETEEFYALPDYYVAE